MRTSAGLSGEVARDGAQTSALPVVPWAQLTTGHPATGATPPGMRTYPVTATGRPSRSAETYITRHERGPVGW